MYKRVSLSCGFTPVFDSIYCSLRICRIRKGENGIYPYDPKRTQQGFPSNLSAYPIAAAWVSSKWRISRSM